MLEQLLTLLLILILVALAIAFVLWLVKQLGLPAESQRLITGAMVLVILILLILWALPSIRAGRV